VGYVSSRPKRKRNEEKTMQTIKLALTEKQTELLQPLFDKLRDNLGMILGQFHEATEGTGFFEVGFLNEEQAIKLQESFGNFCGTITPVELEVYTVVED
jgi:hypothetical protein